MRSSAQPDQLAQLVLHTDTDTQTLGGAGFASQAHTFEPRLCLPDTHYSGLALTLIPLSSSVETPASLEKPHGADDDSSIATGKAQPRKPDTFTLVLKTDVPDIRPDGRRESTISFEYSFHAPSPASIAASETRSSSTIRIPWSSFKPFYRGRPVPPTSPLYHPLNTGFYLTSADTKDSHQERDGICELSLMCRSDFASQEGDFEVGIAALGAIKVDGVEQNGLARTWWNDTLSWFRMAWGWIQQLVGISSTNRLRLP